MKLCFIALILIYGCSFYSPQREVSSLPDHETIFYPADLKLINVQIKTFQNGLNGQSYFYLEFKDHENVYIDIDENQLHLADKKTRKYLKTSTERIMQGRYYLVLEKKMDKNKMLVLYGDSIIENKAPALAKINVDFNLSSLKLISRDESILHFELQLKEETGEWIKTSLTPEIIFDGLGHVSKLVKKAEGIWLFSVTTPDENQIIYLGFNIQGQRKEHWLRFQYVEK